MQAEKARARALTALPASEAALDGGAKPVTQDGQVSISIRLDNV